MAAKSLRRRRNREGRSRLQLPERIEERIESERRRLNKAVAILVGAELTAEYFPELEVVTDATSVARDLVTVAIAALDIRGVAPCRDWGGERCVNMHDTACCLRSS